jgi:hypothetical protein
MVDLGSDPEELQWLLESLLEQSAEQEPRPLLMLQWQQPEQQEPEPQQQELAVRQPELEQQQQEPEPELVRPDPAVAPVCPGGAEEPLRPRCYPWPTFSWSRLRQQEQEPADSPALCQVSGCAPLHQEPAPAHSGGSGSGHTWKGGQDLGIKSNLLKQNLKIRSLKI